VPPEPVVALTLTERLVDRYREYLITEQGLTRSEVL
jgi:hypothetical protein